MVRIAILFVGGLLLISDLAYQEVEDRIGQNFDHGQENRHIQTVVLFALIPVVVAFSFVVFIFYRARREAFFKQREIEFRLTMSELELKAIRAQINPHFIFNCLNSIHHYMQRHNANLAGEYLSKFSQLIRYVLEISGERMVSLTEDLEALKIYLELEQLRMHHSFAFQIGLDDSINAASVRIPPMMIQPFVENSIWHGLNHRGSGGLLSINVSKQGDMLECKIEDNGIRVTKDSGSSSVMRKTSMGMTLIEDRLKVINRLNKTRASFKIEHRQDDPGGTGVTLTLPYED